MGILGGNNAGMMGAMLSIAAQQQAADNAAKAVAQGKADAKGEYATNYYDPYTQTGNAANTMYANALGLNGTAGNTAATGAYQTSPGYDFQMQQGVQALDRSAAGSGLFGSGNAATALTQYGQGLANQDYGNWLSRLQGLGAQGLSTAGGQTGRQGSLANIDTGAATNTANIYTNSGNQISNALSSGYASDAASNNQGQANLISGLLGGANLAGGLLSGGGLAKIAGLAGSAALLSDEDAKTDIEPVGKDPDSGLNLYAYRYKSDPKSYPKVVGPMAQDIEKKHPHLVKKVGGKRIIKAA